MDIFGLLIVLLAVLIGLIVGIVYQLTTTGEVEPVGYSNYRNPWRRRAT